MIAYCDATPADAEALSAAAQQSFSETFGHLYAPTDLGQFLDQSLSPAAYRAELSDIRYRVRLALDGGRVVGFAKLGPPHLPVSPPAGELWQLYVLRDWQGRGVAPALMDWAMQRLRADGHRAMHLSVYVDNHRAKRFYARYGAEDVGRLDFPVGDQIDEDRILRIPL